MLNIILILLAIFVGAFILLLIVLHILLYEDTRRRIGKDNWAVK